MSKNTKQDPTKARVSITQFFRTVDGVEVAIDRQITKRMDLSRFQVQVAKDSK